MASCLLFHGPGARSKTLEYVAECGRLLAPPFGDEGLSVDDAREAVELLSAPPVGEEEGFVVIGPLDLAKSVQAQDALLKNIEQFPDHVRPLLWAHDLGSVSPVIRSRCLDRWCPPTEDDEEDEELISMGYDLVEASLGKGGKHRISAALAKKSSIANKHETELLGILADVLSTDLADPRRLALWERLRLVAQWSNPSRIEIASALLE